MKVTIESKWNIGDVAYCFNNDNYPVKVKICGYKIAGNYITFSCVYQDVSGNYYHFWRDDVNIFTYEKIHSSLFGDHAMNWKAETIATKEALQYAGVYTE